MFAETKYFNINESILLESGKFLKNPVIAYETYGKLNKKKDNAILICHALSGSANAAFYHKGSQKPGWWDFVIGPGKSIDTNKFFVICSNVIGSCYGSTGPSSINPDTNKHYALEFPVITIKDMVKVQKKLIDYLGIDSLYSIIGGSMGGMQVLQWCNLYPEIIKSAVIIATTYKHNAIQIAFHEVGRYAIMSDPNWNNGNYYTCENQPEIGLSIARMIGHITYLSEQSMNRKFGRALKGKEKYGYDFSIDFEVGSYLHYQGLSFTKRFDANSYLYITKALDYFDLTDGYGCLEEALLKAKDIDYLIISFTSDWLYPPEQSQVIAKSLSSIGANCSYINIDADYGHDSFLVDLPQMKCAIKSFLER